MTGGTVEVVEFSVKIYGLVLVLLGISEFLIFFCVRGQVQAKKMMLVGMWIADVTHIVVFHNSWCYDWEGSYVPVAQQMGSWQQREWVAFSTNIPLVVLFLLLRTMYIVFATEPGPRRKKE
ncbi:hypothetical protein FOA52_005389 [Chlamydomonas sp. UWO 241]|nr:hypothetical protein FOA52_005389 [Chlamydomonas sp. UWO 241]